ncbi:MAG: TetR/AcrR family transcriptional regulator [Brevundimonas sp.]|nr:MAG: TetR/AcrR family transcriptional regulator [Brevundimonas sp.]
MSETTREAILAAARKTAQAHGYGGLNFRDLAQEVGIKSASVHYYFPIKADLGAAVARRYWEDTASRLAGFSTDGGDRLAGLRRYPKIFRMSLENGNRLCLCSFMAAEFDDLPEAVKTEVQAFADVNVAWLMQEMVSAGLADPEQAEPRARAVFAAVAGAQLVARSRADLSIFDSLIDSYRTSGLLPA